MRLRVLLPIAKTGSALIFRNERFAIIERIGCTYSLNERLNLALDRLIEDLLVKRERGGNDGEGTKEHPQEKSQSLDR